MPASPDCWKDPGIIMPQLSSRGFNKAPLQANVELTCVAYGRRGLSTTSSEMVSVGGQRPWASRRTSAHRRRWENERSLLLSGTLLVFDELDSLFILILLDSNRR
jgi:hypothetical protein